MATLAHRKLPIPALTIADAWFRNPVCTEPVTVQGAFSATADGACPVTLPDGSVAFVKPRPDADKKLVVAREKIAADLAHVLGLPVAPVAIREPGVGWPHFSAMSLACLRAGRLWQDGGATHFTAASEGLEALRVFWTWIGDADHNGHGGNLLYEVNSGEVALAAIDHSYSLCHGNGGDPLAVGACSGYGTAGIANLEQACRDAVAVIKDVDWSAVEEIVRRLRLVLTTDEQDRIIRVLEVRRDELSRMLGL